MTWSHVVYVSVKPKKKYWKGTWHGLPLTQVVFSGYSDFLHQINWLPWYNPNIVESGIKHHKKTSQNCVSVIIFDIGTFLEKLLERVSDNDLLLCRKSMSNKARYRQWFDRCIISKMILKSGSNWLFPVVFFSWNNIIRVPFRK
jgi:hypothetical protein